MKVCFRKVCFRKAPLGVAFGALAAAVVVAVLVSGCDDNFLTREPPSSLSSETFYQTESDAIAAINAAYGSLQNPPFYSETYPKVAEVPSDDILIHNTTGFYMDNFTWSTAAQQIEQVWTINYEGIFRSNLVLQEVPDIDMPEELKARILGEARFLRGLYYWHLAANFGAVPIITSATPNNPQEAQKPKSEVGAVYEFIIQDLQQAAEALPQSYDASNLGRATKGAAQALLGKTHLYAENYQEAEAAFEQVINSGQYELMPNHYDLFATDNNSEYIFEVQYQDVGGGAWSSQDNADINESTLRDRLNLPEGGGGFGNLVPTRDIFNAFEEGDPRGDYAIWSAGDAFGDQMYNPEWSGGDGLNLRKGLVPLKPFDAAVGTNWPIIRLADVLLMYAEAANENGHRAAALEAVNRVRARSEMPPLPTEAYPTGTKQELFEAIVHERRVELAFEYHRYHDLRRWGLAEEELGHLGYQPRHRYLPIPQAEVDVNDALEQHPAYQ